MAAAYAGGRQAGRLAHDCRNGLRPRHKAIIITREEHALGVWLPFQSKVRRGELAADEFGALDEAVPRWRIGRHRRRRQREQS